MGLTLNKPTLLDVRLAGEYATKFRWVLTFDTSAASFGTFSQYAFLLQNNNIPNYLQQLNVLCQSTNLPTKSVEAMPIAVRGHKHFQPGKVTPGGSISLNFYETVNNQIHTLFMRWQEAIWGHNIGVGLSYDNLVAERIILTRLNNADQPICNYVLKWCFLEGYNNPELSGSNSGPYVSGITLSYNDFFVTGVGSMSLINRYEDWSYVNQR